MSQRYFFVHGASGLSSQVWKECHFLFLKPSFEERGTLAIGETWCWLKARPTSPCFKEYLWIKWPIWSEKEKKAGGRQVKKRRGRRRKKRKRKRRRSRRRGGPGGEEEENLVKLQRAYTCGHETRFCFFFFFLVHKLVPSNALKGKIPKQRSWVWSHLSS